ncbi:protein CURVATURE THYLAKOID 1B [Carex littledalei]|uniref:Protein CURVATURE THYLAKOID 1B n=1 Tax=Carex littledalei TaxID=544730 RepID=A0A833R9Y7_9POAL|nr:protein CURVATURE THYLAKOID 1B [Carex littledalei]
MATAAITSFATGLASASLSGARPLRRHVSFSTIAPLGGVSLNRAQSLRISNNVSVKATGEEASTELPEIVTKLQDTWDKVEDKYAVATLGAVGIIVLWSATGMISAIDRLPVVPGVLELVGIGYTAWFVYSNLVFKPDREALVDKIKSTYSEIIGTS